MNMHTQVLGGVSILLAIALALVLFSAVDRAGNGDGGISPLQGPVPVANLY